MSGYRSIVQRILIDHGHRVLETLVDALPQAVWEAAKAALDKVAMCRTPEGGFVRLVCESCGEMKTVYFTCKSRLCPSCGWRRAHELAESLKQRLIKGRYRHIVFSVPQELRDLFFWRRDLLRIVCHAGAAATMQAYATRCRKYKLLPGIVATCHTFGRNLRFHVHAHLLVTAGGLQIGGVWQPVKFLPPKQFRKYWQYYLLTQLRKALPEDDPWQSVIGSLFTKHPTGFIVNLQTCYRSLTMALAYCLRYQARPPIGDSRILDYDGHHVTFEYKDYRTGTTKSQRCPVDRFVHLLLQHVLPRYARNIHYYGLFRTQVWRKRYEQVRKVSKYPQNVPDGTGRPLTWRERIIKAFSVDPVSCPTCGTEMVVDQIQLPPRFRSPPAATNRQRQLQTAFDFG